MTQQATAFQDFLLKMVTQGSMTADIASEKYQAFLREEEKEVPTVQGHIVLMNVPSMSNPRKTYEIRKSNRDNVVYCTCPAWRFSKGEKKTCKHLSRYEAEYHPAVLN